MYGSFTLLYSGNIGKQVYANKISFKNKQKSSHSKFPGDEPHNMVLNLCSWLQKNTLKGGWLTWGFRAKHRLPGYVECAGGVSISFPLWGRNSKD